MSNQYKKCRICIIGAGPAGLAAAEALKEQGYDDITILEKKNRVGGQALSLSYKTADNRDLIYELGSVQPLGIWSGNFGRLLKQYDIQFNKPLRIKLHSFDKKQTVVDFTSSFIGYPLKDLFNWFLDLSKLSYYLLRYRKLSQPVYTNLPEKYTQELSIPFSQWIEERNFHLIGKDLNVMAGSMITFSNPARKNQVPALKLIKLLLEFIKLPPRYINGQIIMAVKGYDEIWKRIAKNHNVKLNASIKKITRSASGIKVEMENETLECDKLIITCAPHQTLKFLEDATLDEKEIFSKVNYNPGWRAAFIAKNLPHDAAYTFYEPFSSHDYPIRLVAFIPHHQITEDTWLYSAIFSYDKKEDFNKVIEQTNKALKEQFNAEVLEWLNQSYWGEYTPYFSCDDVKNGIYKKLESLQGLNNTIYLGAMISGGTHGIVVNYAYQKIKEFFPPIKK